VIEASVQALMLKVDIVDFAPTPIKARAHLRGEARSCVQSQLGKEKYGAPTTGAGTAALKRLYYVLSNHG
jgi:hypothetical protein